MLTGFSLLILPLKLSATVIKWGKFGGKYAER